MDRKIYTLLLLLAFLSLASTIFIPSVILWHSGETWSKEALVRHQIKHNAVIGYGLFDDEKAYKKTLYKTLNPEIIIIGSSRVLQYKAEMFSRPFLNMGRGLALYDLKNEVDILTDNPNLKIVLFGIDYWNFGNHFCEAFENYIGAKQAVGVNSANISKFSNLIPREILNVWPMILDGRISLSLFVKYASEFFIDDKSSLNKLGLRALYSNKGGYLKDGSFVYPSKFMNPQKMALDREASIVRVLASGVPYQIPKADKFCSQTLSNLLYFKKALDNKGVKLIAFLPPLPERHARLIMSKENSFEIYNAMMGGFKKVEPGISVQDYFSPDVEVYSDKEFIDEIHPGETISSRILFDIAKKNSAFANNIDIHLLQKNIKFCAEKATCSNKFKKYVVSK